MNTCPYVCNNKTEYGYCKTTVCINPIHNNKTVNLNQWLDKEDYVQVVRCKDCKHGSPNGKYGCRVYHYRRYETHDMKPDDYCSRGERKENEVD